MTGLTIKAALAALALAFSTPAIAQDALQDTEITTDDLSAAGAGTIGTMTLETGGLSVEMWADSNLERIKFLLSRVDLSQASPAIRALVRKIMLTEARLPDGASEDDNQAIFAERVRILFEMGDVIALEQLMERLSQTASRIFPGYVRINLGQLLLRDGLEAGCAAPGREAPAPEFGREWVGKVNAACANLGEAGPEGEVQLQLAVDLDPDDTLFPQLMARLRGESDEAPELEGTLKLDPLHIALMEKTGIALEPRHLAYVTPDALVGLARSGRAPALVRAMAAEQAMAWGIITPQDVRVIYNQLALQAGAGEITAPPEAEDTLNRAREFARLAQALDPSGRGRDVIRMLERAKAEQSLRITALVYADMAARIAPGPDTIIHGATVLRALILTGRNDEARIWHTAIVNEARSGLGVALRQLFEVWPLLVASGPEVGADGASVLAVDWYNFALQQYGRAGIDKAIAVFSLTEAMGEPIAAEAWDRIIAARAASRAKAELPNLSIWRGIAEAAAAKRQAEAGLLAVLLLDGGKLTKAHPVVTSAILGAFLSAGMETDARALARDAMMALGL